MAKTKKQKRSFIVSFCIIALCAYFAVSLISVNKEIAAVKKEIAVAQQANARQVAENEKLRDDMSSGDIDEYVEKVARDKFGFVMPGERVYYDVSVNN